MKAPTAETVATAEPEMAAKNMQTTMVTMPRPPVMWPMKHSKKFTRRLAIPPPLIKFPASIKKGMAKSGKESTPAMLFWAIIRVGMEVNSSMVTRVTMPMAYPMGTLSMRRIRKSPKRKIASMVCYTSLGSWLPPRSLVYRLYTRRRLKKNEATGRAA